MCGLAGFIGKSKNICLSFSIITNLLQFSEPRGIDASGVWASETGYDGKVFYDKLPKRPYEYINSEFWNNLSEIDLDLLIAHARGASKGVGEPQFNENNHPFVSEDKMLALIHNGRIHDCEYNLLKKRYLLQSTCDSEILLKIIEDLDESRSDGIKQIFDLLPYSQMAVALAERLEDSKSLWLFRNECRPLWIFDAFKDLGQIFFASEREIWEKSLGCLDQQINYECLELPVGEIWNFKKQIYTTDIETEKIKINDLPSCLKKVFTEPKQKKVKPLCQTMSGVKF